MERTPQAKKVTFKNMEEQRNPARWSEEEGFKFHDPTFQALARRSHNRNKSIEINQNGPIAHRQVVPHHTARHPSWATLAAPGPSGQRLSHPLQKDRNNSGTDQPLLTRRSVAANADACRSTPPAPEWVFPGAISRSLKAAAWCW